MFRRAVLASIVISLEKTVCEQDVNTEPNVFSVVGACGFATKFSL